MFCTNGCLRDEMSSVLILQKRSYIVMLCLSFYSFLLFGQKKNLQSSGMRSRTNTSPFRESFILQK